MALPRGIRNNNPGNIRKGQNWIGESKDQSDPDFEVFTSPEYGIRAIVKIIQSYRNRGLDSIRKIISAWAPSSENNTEAYIKSVSQQVGVGADDCLNFTNDVWIKLIKGIIMHENGQQPYSDDIIQKGIDLAING